MARGNHLRKMGKFALYVESVLEENVDGILDYSAEVLDVE
jgi:hypothetical protein